MGATTIRYGIALIVLGFIFFIVTGGHAMTALIPVWFGLALIFLGILARTENTKQRMTVMHIAAVVGVVGAVFPGVRGGMAVLRRMQGVHIAHRSAVLEEGLMALVCLLFVVACVGSFREARRLRTV